MGQQTSATKSIPDLFGDADEIIYEDINGLMEHVELAQGAHVGRGAML